MAPQDVRIPPSPKTPAALQAMGEELPPAESLPPSTASYSGERIQPAGPVPLGAPRRASGPGQPIPSLGTQPKGSQPFPVPQPIRRRPIDQSFLAARPSFFSLFDDRIDYTTVHNSFCFA